jgi:inner membrane transporter RhtA
LNGNTPPAVSVFPIAVTLFTIFCFEAGAALAKGLFHNLGALGAATVRLFFGTLFLWAWWRPWRGALTGQQSLGILAYGVSLGGMSLFFYMALARLPLGLTLSLEMTGPLTLSLILSRRLLDIVWVAAAATGLLLLLPFGDSIKGLDPEGAMFAVSAGICWAFYIVAGQKAGASLPQGRAIALTMAVATLVVAPFGLLHARQALFDRTVLPIALLSGLFSTAIPYSLDLFAMSRIPARLFGLLMSLAPVVGALVGFVMLDERLTPLQWSAILCIVTAAGGSSLSNGIARSRRRLSSVSTAPVP